MDEYKPCPDCHDGKCRECEGDGMIIVDCICTCGDEHEDEHDCVDCSGSGLCPTCRGEMRIRVSDLDREKLGQLYLRSA